MTLTVMMPVTRDWTRVAVCEAIGASDIPRERALLILDAPGCEKWGDALSRLGFLVEIYQTGKGTPPAGRIERRARHRAMRRLSQELVSEGPLLCLEDDTLVPPDVYARLSSIGPHASGVQIGRHGLAWPGIYPLRPRMGTGVEAVEGCGHYCLLTTGEAYRAAGIRDTGKAVDEQHTSQLRPLFVDWSCVCGHLTEEGVLWPS